MRSHRRVSCRDLGAGECDGWLWKKKTNSTSPLSSKWSKRWVVLKENALYSYHTEEDDKAESYIYLPGYKVTPALESKRRFAFRVAHPERKTFYFASDRQTDMSRWMNKLGLAAIEYAFPSAANHTAKEESYFSESDSEETSNASGPESVPQTPNISPDKPLKSVQNTTPTVTPPRNRNARHMSTQPDLNRSARYPKNKAELLKATATTQTTDSLQKEGRTRSKSEVTRSSSTPVSEQGTANAPISNGNNSLVTSPLKKSPVYLEDRKHITNDANRKQYEGSSSSEVIPLTSSHSEGELKHLKSVSNNKAYESVKRESEISTSSLTSSKSEDSVLSSKSSGMFAKSKKHKKSLSKDAEKDGEIERGPSTDGQPVISPGRRDLLRRPKSKSDSIVSKQGGSIDDWYKEFKHEDVDIRGVNRKASLRRRVTILAKDPRKNDLLLKKRALQRLIKAREGELEYFKLLDDKEITSEELHDWINQHQSFLAELGTIRRLSKRKKNPDKPTEGRVSDNEKSDVSAPNKTSPIIPPVPAKRTSLLLTDTASLGLSTKDSIDRHELSDSGLPPPPTYTSKSWDIEARVRPRSWAISVSDGDKMKARSPKSVSPHHEVPVEDSDKAYLETDL